MATTTIDAEVLKKLFLAGAANLEAKKEWINDLNVFPVPDGDTGTNMTLTIMSAAKEVNSLAAPTMQTLSKAISGGSLRGARGNSGVILSQLLRGFTKVVRDYDELDSIIISTAFQKAVETAYKAVMKPKEGTILTVARGMADKILDLSTEIDDLEELLDKVIKYGDEVLEHTPDLLPVLKQAGVVDSGGQGLMQIMKGAYDALMGKEINYEAVASQGGPSGSSEVSAQGLEEKEIKFGYCTEFIVMLEKPYDAAKEAEFKAYLESIGDSIVLVSDGEIVKVHVHTNHPGLAFEKGLTFGSLTRMKVDNMREEHQERVIANAEKAAKEQAKKDEPKKKYGFISVSAGEGLSEIFKSLGVDYIIEGGQTMNPSTEDMLNAIDKVNAENVFIFPNNSNIILAANQAQSIVEDKNIIVIPTKTIPQGISALIAYSEEASPEENTEAMTEEIANIKSGSVTYAVRDTEIDDKTIKQGDIMGIGDKTILSVGQNIQDVTKDMIEQLAGDDAELISIYYGSDVTEEDANALAKAVEAVYPDVDVEVNYGGQPIYYYILSVE
ncbi:MAG TPA: DAK2 domain-containing protein [Lachnospiraceae bacterium]|nr:DAK2 domain-containing protein [Lachnospiraceae bacterium]